MGRGRRRTKSNNVMKPRHRPGLFRRFRVGSHRMTRPIVARGHGMTWADVDIWAFSVWRRYPAPHNVALQRRSLKGDRRDARLMLALEQMRPAFKFRHVWSRAHRRMTIGIGALRDDPWANLQPRPVKSR